MFSNGLYNDRERIFESNDSLPSLSFFSNLNQFNLLKSIKIVIFAESITWENKDFSFDLIDLNLYILYGENDIIGYGNIDQISIPNVLFKSSKTLFHVRFDISSNQLYIFAKKKRIIAIDNERGLEKLLSAFLSSEGSGTPAIKVFFEIEKLQLEYPCNSVDEKFILSAESIFGNNNSFFSQKLSLNLFIGNSINKGGEGGGETLKPINSDKRLLFISENVHLSLRSYIYSFINILRINFNELEQLNRIILLLLERFSTWSYKLSNQDEKSFPMNDINNDQNTGNEIKFKNGYLKNNSFHHGKIDASRFIIKKLKSIYSFYEEGSHIDSIIIARKLILNISSIKEYWKSFSINFSQFMIKINAQSIFRIEKNFNSEGMKVLYKKNKYNIDYCLEVFFLSIFLFLEQYYEYGFGY